MQDTSNLPISGGAFVAGMVYIAITYFITAEVIGERTIAKSDWNKQCTSQLRALILDDTPQADIISKLDCNSTIGLLLGRQGMDVCRKHGNPSFNLPFLNQLNEQKRRMNEYKHRRLQSAASRVGSKCDCAISVSLEKNRNAWALYAGSVRLVMPHSVKNFSSELQSALNSSHCASNK